MRKMVIVVCLVGKVIILVGGFDDEFVEFCRGIKFWCLVVLLSILGICVLEF